MVSILKITGHLVLWSILIKSMIKPGEGYVQELSAFLSCQFPWRILSKYVPTCHQALNC